jgi:hypothetical protein
LGAETDLTVADRRWLSPLPLWTGILAGLIAWAMQLEASYALVHWTCTSQRVEIYLVISAVALLITAGGAAISWTALQRASDAPMDAGSERARARFMAVLGLSLGLLAAIAIVAAAIPPWVVDACH